MSCRSKPYVRSCLKIGPLLEALAREVESGSGHTDHALANLKLVAPYRRFAIAALLADLTLEHRRLVLQTDYEDPDPTAVEEQLRMFEDRCRVLFTEGAIMTSAMKDTCTAQVVEGPKPKKKY